MKCPACKGTDEIVIDTRDVSEGQRRRRECRTCGHKWNTIEMSMSEIEEMRKVIHKYHVAREAFNA